MFLKYITLGLFCMIALATSTPLVSRQCSISSALKEEIKSYEPIVHEIIETIVNGKFKGDTYKSLEKFTDKFGPRLAGSKSLEKSIDYMIDEFKNLGLENVHTEDVEINRWVRGVEKAYLISPRQTNLPILGLGNSVGTPPGGIKASAVVVESFDELRSLPDSLVEGKIVIFVPQWKGYGPTVAYRGRGASEAAKKGAIASLIRSITPFSIASLHTGMQSYEKGVMQIPTASITVEDAERLLRYYRAGEEIIITLRMDDYMAGPGMSRNTIGELQGSVHQNTSVVVVSGHLDSWDVGVGAMDDGGGAWISWKAVQYLKAMGLRPKRTIRAILWTAEEFGYIGAKKYQANHRSTEKEEFNFFFESDGGTFEPRGLEFSGNLDAECIYREILELMAPLNATEFSSPADGGPDISLWLDRGFPGGSLLNKDERYFWYHHSAGDSMLVEDSGSLDKNAALFAAASYVIADLSVNMPRSLQ